ncbi:MAG: Rho termination factor N-terminal domain-containing protein, partial [Actinomycetota bacterium]|nr:Rho termination factor N-terminal domain-containing protein [Actinomycetota bacterium]
MTDTTDLLQEGAVAPASPETQDAAAAAAPRTRRRATSGGLAAMVLPELQAMAGQLGISGVGRLRKSQLIEAIQTSQAGTSRAAAPTADPAPAGSDAAGSVAGSPSSGAVRTARNGASPATASVPVADPAVVAPATEPPPPP